MVLVFSLVLTIGVTYLFFESARSKDLLRFNNELVRARFVIENKINLCLSMLKGGRGFIESSDELTRKHFSNYINNLELDKNYVGVRGIGYSKVILPKERDSLIKQMKSEGYANFKIFPEKERDSYQAIIYFEPLNEENKQIIGFDMSTEANRRTALEKARDSGEAAASAKVSLLQEREPNKPAGFLIYLPIYKKEKPSSTVEERKQNLEGYIYSPFNAKDFLNEARTIAAASNIAIAIYDGEAEAENLLAETDLKIDRDFTNKIYDQYGRHEDLYVAGRKWTIVYTTMPTFAEQSSVGWTPLILLCGTGFSFLLFGMTYWEATARAKLQITAAELFESEKQKQTLFEKEQKARLSAEQANKTKDEFIAVVSHELRTPLNAIAGWTRILGTENLSNNTKYLALDKIEKNLRSQTDLVEELLNYSQIISGNVSGESEKIDFSLVFEYIVQKIERAAHEKEITLIKVNRLNGHHILGNENKIKIVIQNLLSNAVKFTPYGGRVEASALVDNGHIKLIVKDNGRGISADYLPYIFDRFQQADNSITRTHGGLGLGLAISHHIVKLHKGTIEAESKGVGKGSTFTVKIPYV